MTIKCPLAKETKHYYFFLIPFDLAARQPKYVNVHEEDVEL